MEAFYEIGHHVGHLDGSPGDPDSVCYVAVLPAGPPLVLEGSAAAIWRAAAAGGSAEDIVGRVAAAVGIRPDEIADDVVVFLDGMVSRGLLILKQSGGDPSLTEDGPHA